MAQEDVTGKTGAQAPTWPSVEEQFAAANVTPGSALEKLIRENQDFNLLRPEEANDDLKLPPWLRVYWHKAHPNQLYSAISPSIVYPQFLYNMLAWMLRHQDLRPASSPNLAGSGAASALSGGDGASTCGQAGDLP